jgi:hypothetical protein
MVCNFCTCIPDFWPNHGFGTVMLLGGATLLISLAVLKRAKNADLSGSVAHHN